MAASPHSQETVNQLFERNYVPVLWHEEIECCVCLTFLNSSVLDRMLRLGAAQH